MGAGKTTASMCGESDMHSAIRLPTAAEVDKVNLDKPKELLMLITYTILFNTSMIEIYH